MDVPVDDGRKDRRLAPVRGGIRGTITYVGPRPCSKDGHVVGSAVIMVFDRRNPPPPSGVATSAVNFVAISGDRLFANVPRSVDATLYCPPDTETITASAPFTIAPLDPASYVVKAFYDRRGHFLPTFGFRNQPLAGDVSGGVVDPTNPVIGSLPNFLPVDVGTPVPGDKDPIPAYQIGPNGFVADNVAVTIGSSMPFTRPYFHPDGAERAVDRVATDANPTGDPLGVPVVTMTQDASVLAFPANPTATSIAAYQASFASVRLNWGVANAEVAAATADPFVLQLPPVPPDGKGGLLVFASGQGIPENTAVPALWPQVAFVKLADEPVRSGVAPTLVVQGTPEETNVTGKAPKPMVVIRGVTLFDDSLAKTITGPIPAGPSVASLRDHVDVLVRPAALCLNPRRADLGGVLVTPAFTGPSADPKESGDKPLFDPAAVASQPLVREVRQGCLPKGRYAISLVYPTGQTWTVPNEVGTCDALEGAVLGLSTPTSCSAKPRPALLSQGPRAVLEIVAPDGAGMATCAETPVPDECLHL